jgi:hypothetical protein
MANNAKTTNLAPRFVRDSERALVRSVSITLTEDFLAKADTVASSMNVDREVFLRRILEREVEKLLPDPRSIDPNTGWARHELDLLKRCQVPPMKKPEDAAEAEKIMLDLMRVVGYLQLDGYRAKKAHAVRARIMRKYTAIDAPEPV